MTAALVLIAGLVLVGAGRVTVEWLSRRGGPRLKILPAVKEHAAQHR